MDTKSLVECIRGVFSCIGEFRKKDRIFAKAIDWVQLLPARRAD